MWSFICDVLSACQCRTLFVIKFGLDTNSTNLALRGTCVGTDWKIVCLVEHLQMHEKVPSDVAKLRFWGCFCLSGAKNCAILKVISLPYLSCDARTNVIFRDVSFQTKHIRALERSCSLHHFAWRRKTVWHTFWGWGRRCCSIFLVRGSSPRYLFCGLCVAEHYFGWRWGFGVILFHCLICIVFFVSPRQCPSLSLVLCFFTSRLRWGGRQGHLTSLKHSFWGGGEEVFLFLSFLLCLFFWGGGGVVACFPGPTIHAISTVYVNSTADKGLFVDRSVFWFLVWTCFVVVVVVVVLLLFCIFLCCCAAVVFVGFVVVVVVIVVVD